MGYRALQEGIVEGTRALPDVDDVALLKRATISTERPRASRKLLVGDVLVAVLLIAGAANLLVWRIGMLSHIGWAGWALVGVETVTACWLVLTALLIIGRAHSATAAPAPDLNIVLDVLIPVAGEPEAMVAETIAAAKRLDWPDKNIVVCNDGRMANKANWRAIEKLCRTQRVRCMTRRDGYPGKAGNLNHAMSKLNGDVVLVIDADHVVEPGAAKAMLGWFEADDVAIVSTPQRFHGQGRDPLNPTEPTFYKAIQTARNRHGLAFSTGNGVMYRRQALTRIGGFSEWSVVEDLHTSIRLHDAGWKSVLHPRPVTTGVAPSTSAEYARQRLRWSIDSLRILRHDSPWRRRGLTSRAKIFYSHTLLSYLVAIVQLGFLLGPPAWILGRLSLMVDGDIGNQVRYIGPWLAVVVLSIAWWSGNVRGAIRSMRLTAAFQPTIFVLALKRVIRPKGTAGGATNKDSQPTLNGMVLTGLMWPTMLVGTLLFAMLDTRSGGSDIAILWAAVMALFAIGPLLRGGTAAWPWFVKGLFFTLAVSISAGAVATARFGWTPPQGIFESLRPDPALVDAEFEENEFGDTVVLGPAVPAPEINWQRLDSADVGRAEGSSEQPSSSLKLAPSSEGIYVGFTSDALPHNLDDANRWASAIAEPQIVHWYQQWGSGDSRFRGDWVAEVAESGRVPMISWEAWAKPEGSFASAEQELGNMAAIAAGEHDAYIDDWAEAAAEFGGPILLRPFHEMNGFWYPWSVGVNGNTADDYIAGWRHVVDRFDAAGATNVSFVWSVNTLANFDQSEDITEFYPGDDYVDWVATSGFNWDNYDTWASWVTAEEVFAPTYEVLLGFDKPVMFAEIGTGNSTGGGDEWVAEAAEWFATLPELDATVWFDRSYNSRIDFRLDRGQRATLARAVANPDFGYVPDLVLDAQPDATLAGDAAAD